jgi:hypothetical protein
VATVVTVPLEDGNTILIEVADDEQQLQPVGRSDTVVRKSAETLDGTSVADQGKGSMSTSTQSITFSCAPAQTRTSQSPKERDFRSLHELTCLFELRRRFIQHTRHVFQISQIGSGIRKKTSGVLQVS